MEVSKLSILDDSDLTNTMVTMSSNELFSVKDMVVVITGGATGKSLLLDEEERNKIQALV